MIRVLWIVLLLSGCTFQSNQVDLILGFLDREPEIDYRWQASISNRSWILTAVSTENLMIFMNNHGDALAFDGWTIRSLVGFGLSPLTITREEKFRVFKSESSVFRHSCGSWSKNQLENGMSRILQTCEGANDYENFILLDKDGSIVQIDQVVTGDGYRIRLNKL
tara:strand:- start:139 stop:633 length:495 start_codon:yes stop_codon:yes gene_type:complete